MPHRSIKEGSRQHRGTYDQAQDADHFPAPRLTLHDREHQSARREHEQGQSWGWTSVRVLGLIVGSAVLTAAFLYRSVRHAAPVLELRLFRSRAFSAANIASTLFFAAFGAMLLSNVLFLTRVWHEDILTAGLQISPGPIMA